MGKQAEIKASQINTMVSDQYEVYHVKDVVSQEKTLYHYHDFYEIHATLEGSGTFFLDGQQFEIEAGTLLLIHFNDMHRIIKQNSDYFERVYIFITPNFLKATSTKWSNLESCFQAGGHQKSLVLKTDPKRLREKLAFIDAPPSKIEFGSDIKYQEKLVDYLIFINRLVQAEDFESQVSLHVDNQRIAQMMSYVSENLALPLSLEEMEQNFFVSKYYITREFKKHTGITFHQFVLKKRLLLAKQLLKEYQSSTMVYAKAGFVSYAHFLKAFKKEFHMTPKEFLAKDNENQKIHFQHFDND